MSYCYEILHFCSAQGGAFTSSLQSIVGLRGKSAVLPCTPNLNHYTVNWKLLSRYSGHGTRDNTLYNGYDVSNASKYEVGRYDLTVRGLDLEDAGTYSCHLLRNGNSAALTTEGIWNTELTVVGNYCVIRSFLRTRISVDFSIIKHDYYGSPKWISEGFSRTKEIDHLL